MSEKFKDNWMQQIKLLMIVNFLLFLLKLNSFSKQIIGYEDF